MLPISHIQCTVLHTEFYSKGWLKRQWDKNKIKPKVDIDDWTFMPLWLSRIISRCVFFFLILHDIWSPLITFHPLINDFYFNKIKLMGHILFLLKSFLLKFDLLSCCFLPLAVIEREHYTIHQTEYEKKFSCCKEILWVPGI